MSVLIGPQASAVSNQSTHAVPDDANLLNRDRPVPQEGFEQLGKRAAVLVNMEAAVIADIKRAVPEFVGERCAVIVASAPPVLVVQAQAMGNVKGIPPGDVQRMSAGTGVTHSEFNHAEGETTHFLQIWILPKFTGIRPSYEQRTIPDAEKRGALRLVASPDGMQGSVRINADAKVYAGLFDGSETAELALNPARKGYVHLVRGSLAVNGQRLSAGDAALLESESRIGLTDGADAEVLVFDLAP